MWLEDLNDCSLVSFRAHIRCSTERVARHSPSCSSEHRDRLRSMVELRMDARLKAG